MASSTPTHDSFRFLLVVRKLASSRAASFCSLYAWTAKLCKRSFDRGLDRTSTAPESRYLDNRTVSVRTWVLCRLDGGAAADADSLIRPVNITIGTTSLEKFLEDISEDTWVSRWVPYVSSGSPSVLITREDVGEGVRGSRDSRFRRNSSSYGTSRMTNVGTLELSSCVILDRHERPEPHMWTLPLVSHKSAQTTSIAYLR